MRASGEAEGGRCPHLPQIFEKKFLVPDNFWYFFFVFEDFQVGVPNLSLIS
jgi:hypothetical protein